MKKQSYQRARNIQNATFALVLLSCLVLAGIIVIEIASPTTATAHIGVGAILLVAAALVGFSGLAKLARDPLV